MWFIFNTLTNAPVIPCGDMEARALNRFIHDYPHLEVCFIIV